MRELRRPRVRLPTLEDITIEYDGKVHLAPGDGGPPEDKWKNADVRGALYAMHNRVCAYCQNLVSDRIGDVEHFRPKSTYRWLQYVFSNYLLSCRICNSYKKGSKFPRLRGARLTHDSPQGFAEERLLLDPSVDQVEEWITVRFDKPNCELNAAEGIPADAAKQVTGTIEFFDLNEDDKLWDPRAEAVDETNALIDRMRAGEKALESQIRRKASLYAPHGWIVREYLRREAPEIGLPDMHEALGWFLDTLLRRLQRAVEFHTHPRTASERDDLETKRDETSWTLAVLWHDPPVGARDDVRAVIEGKNMLKYVQPNYDQLT